MGVVGGVEDEAARGLDRAAEMHRNGLVLVRGLDFELLEQVREAERFEELVDDEAHRAVFRVGAHVDDGVREARVRHRRHGDQQLPLQVGSRAVLAATVHYTDP